jgi:hypothetical protein
MSDLRSQNRSIIEKHTLPQGLLQAHLLQSNYTVRKSMKNKGGSQ